MGNRLPCPVLHLLFYHLSLPFSAQACWCLTKLQIPEFHIDGTYIRKRSWA
uniref:Uncharacterized protein n=1 Tax=Anolis carolinensis TaxID=28377 RepID=A0A803SR72_ANOCA